MNPGDSNKFIPEEVYHNDQDISTLKILANRIDYLYEFIRGCDMGVKDPNCSVARSELKTRLQTYDKKMNSYKHELSIYEGSNNKSKMDRAKHLSALLEIKINH